MDIFFSIVIPTYNRAHLLVPTLSTVLHQDYENFEVIIIDDGSNDNTKEVLEKEFRNNSKLRYHWQENSERGAARNQGLKLSKGDYVIFFDSDDFMQTNHLSVLYSYIKKLGKVNFIATKHDWLRNGKHEPSTIEVIPEGWYDKQIFIEGNGLACNFCVKRANPSLIKFQEDRSLSIMEDWIFLLQNLLKDQIFLINEVTITLNDHETRSLTLNPDITIKKRLHAMKWIKENIALTLNEQQKLEGHSYLSCAVFSYIGNKTLLSLSYLGKAISLLGLNKNMIMLFLKNITGVSKIKKIISK